MHLMRDLGKSAADLMALIWASNVTLANPEQHVLDAMLEGWARQQTVRGLRPDTIKDRQGVVMRLHMRFHDFVGGLR